MIRRDILWKIRASLWLKEIILVTGPRSVGKTTLLTVLKNELKHDWKDIIFLSLDDEKDLWNFRSALWFTGYITGIIGRKPCTIIIDNIEHQKDVAHILREIYDTDLPYKFILGSTGDKWLIRGLNEILGPRMKTFELKTCSFKEFLQYKTGYYEPGTLINFFKNHTSPIQDYLLEFMAFGGYPDIIMEDSHDKKRELIKQIYKKHIEKDVSHGLVVRRTDAYKQVNAILANNIQHPLTYKHIALEANITFPTLKQYIQIGEATYITNILSPISSGDNTNEITKSPLVYFADTGLRNYLIHTFWDIHRAQNEFPLFKNTIANILLDFGKKNEKELHFWKTKQGAEVDFVLAGRNNTAPLPIEISQHARTNGDITRSMRWFIDRYNPPLAWVITPKYEWTITVNKTLVRFMPYWYLFLLDN